MLFVAACVTAPAGDPDPGGGTDGTEPPPPSSQSLLLVAYQGQWYGGQDHVTFDAPVGAQIGVDIAWGEVCTGGILTGSCTTPTATTHVTTSGAPAKTREVGCTPSGHSDNRGGCEADDEVEATDAGTLAIAVTSTNDVTGEVVSGGATVIVHALDDLRFCALAGTSATSTGSCAAAIAPGTPFGISISGDFDGHAFDIQPSLAWTDLGATPEPACHPAHDARRNPILWCVFASGITQPVTVEATQAAVYRAFTLDVAM